MEFKEFLSSQRIQNAEQARQVASLRPTLFIGLGGFGCSVVRRLKKEVGNLIPDQAAGFSFLGLDTHPQPLTDVLTVNEYVALSIGVDPNEAARAQPQFLGWYRELAGAYRARNIQAGADRVKVVGRLAFRNNATFHDFVGKLSLAMDALNRFREDFAVGVPTKVYVISTLAGGTGAGCLLDLLLVVGKTFRDAAGADFPYQAILATPDVLLGEAPMGHMPDLYANTYATLKEIHSFFTSDVNPVIDYDDAEFQRLRLGPDLLPDPLHLISHKNEAGTSVASKIEELAGIVVSYLLSEIQTPMEDREGQPKVQDKENTYFDTGGEDDLPRAFSSFGVVRTGFPADVIANLFALRLIQATLAAELQGNPNAFEDVSTWLDSHNLKESGVDQLQELIKNEIGRDLLMATVDTKGNILKPGFKYETLVAKCNGYQKQMEKALENEKKKALDEKRRTITERLAAMMQATLDHLLKQRRLGEAGEFVRKLVEALKSHREALKKEIADSKTLLGKLQKEEERSIEGVEVAIPGWWGRKQRVEEAVSDFEARLESTLNQQIDLWIKEEADEIYAGLLDRCKNVKDQYEPIEKTLEGRLKNVEALITNGDLHLDQIANIGSRGPGNRFSLIDSKRARTQYDELIKPDQSGAITRLRSQWLGRGLITDTQSSVEQWLNSIMPNVLDTEIKPKLTNLSFTSVFERFYPDDESKRRLFQDLQSLSSPLFWLDPNRKETNYDSYWIIAVHPDQKAEFIRRYEEYLPGEGRIYAFFDSPYEVILYRLKFGYTIHSYRGLKTYQSNYNRLLSKYKEGRLQKKPVRPIHCWVEAEEWDDLFPSRESEESGKWFILGRAFNCLFPSPEASSSNDRKNVAYLYARGSNYYFEPSGGKNAELIGKGLVAAFRNFAERSDWQQVLQKKVEDKIAEVGEHAVRERLEKEYFPILKAEIDTARKNPDPQDRERAQILGKLKDALEKYATKDLRTSKV